MARRRLVRVPASSANLGPGFDVFAAAVALHVELEVVESGRFGVDTKLDIARDRRNLCVRGFARLHPPERFTFRIPFRVTARARISSAAGGTGSRSSRRSPPPARRVLICSAPARSCSTGRSAQPITR